MLGLQAAVKVLRGGKVLDLEMRLSTYNRLIPEHLNQRPPSYLVIAGFVFTQASTPLISTKSSCRHAMHMQSQALHTCDTGARATH